MARTLVLRSHGSVFLVASVHSIHSLKSCAGGRTQPETQSVAMGSHLFFRFGEAKEGSGYKLESHKTSIVSFFFAREALIPSWELSWMLLKVSSVISA